MANDDVSLMLKITGTVVSVVSLILVNNRFVLGKVDACNKEINDKITSATKSTHDEIDEKTRLIYDNIAARDILHSKTCREDRGDLKDDMKECFRRFESSLVILKRELKEHIDLKVKNVNN